MPFSSKACLIRTGPGGDDELLAGLGHHLETDLDAVIAELIDALHLERFDDVGREFRILRQFLPICLMSFFALSKSES